MLNTDIDVEYQSGLDKQSDKTNDNISIDNINNINNIFENFKMYNNDNVVNNIPEVVEDFRNTSTTIFTNLYANKHINVTYVNGNFVFLRGNISIGLFSVSNVALYIISKITSKKLISSKVTQTIETYLVKCHNNGTKYIDIHLKHPDKSPFMNNINMVILFNNNIDNYRKHILDDYLMKINVAHKSKIKKNIDNFICVMLSYTMQLISTISKSIKSFNNENNLKCQLMRYSINTMYKISQYVHNQLGELMNLNKEIENSMLVALKLKAIIAKKMDILVKETKNNKLQHFDISNATNNNDTYQIIPLSKPVNTESIELNDVYKQDVDN